MQTEKGLIDVYGVWYQPFWKIWQIQVFFIVTLVVLLLFIMRRYRKVKQLTSEQKALQALHRMRSQNYTTAISLHDAYFNLTMIAKQYFEILYGISLHEKTDLEVVELLRGNVPENMLLLLQEFFDRAFRIKFAYDVVSETMLHGDIDMLHKIIIETHKFAQGVEKF